LVTDDSARKIFNDASDKLALAYKVDTRLQRLDSVHIFSNMAQLGRVRLLSRVITIFLKNLKRHHKEEYNDPDLLDIKFRYEKDKDSHYFGNVKPSGSQKRLEDVARDLYILIDRFQGSEEIKSMYSYKTMERVFKEHCYVEHNEVIVKSSTEIPSDSLQNPSDCDATYDGHKGQGYQVQIMETYSRKDMSDESEENKLNLLTYVELEPAHKHDSGALEPALEDVSERDLLPEQLSADTLYGSESNREKSKEYGVELVAPVPGKKPEKDLTVFEFDKETCEIKSCPAGHSPQEIKHNKGSETSIFPAETCSICPLRESCPAKPGKRGYLLNYRIQEAKLTILRQYEQSDEFKDKYRYRSGIEATNSRYIHMTGARRLRYRGLYRMAFAARLKALGINIFRAAKYVRQQGESTSNLTNIELEFAI
jgi:hypothetical protein